MTSLLSASDSPLNPFSALLIALLTPLAILPVVVADVGGTYEAGVPLEAATDLTPVPKDFNDTLVSVVAGKVSSTPEATIELYVEVFVVWLVVCAEGGQGDRLDVLQTTLVRVYSEVTVAIVEDASSRPCNKVGAVLFALVAVVAVEFTPLDAVADALIAQAEYSVV